MIGNPGADQLFGFQSGDDRSDTESGLGNLGKPSITINAVAPGFIESDMTKALGDEVLKGGQEADSSQSIGAC